MAKLTADQKVWRKEALNEVAQQGGKVFSFPMDGVTVAIMPCIPNMARAKFVRVAVSHCARDDKFKRKVGEFEAATRILGCASIALPIANYEGMFVLADTDETKLAIIAQYFAEYIGQ